MDKFFLKPELNYVTIEELKTPSRRLIVEDAENSLTTIYKGFPRSSSSTDSDREWAIMKEVIDESTNTTISWYWWRSTTAKQFKWSDLDGDIPLAADANWGDV